MKIVYVLTSSEEDYYYEQFFLSLSSLRLLNPYAEVIALTDLKTKQSLIGKRERYEILVSELKTINVPEDFSKKESSRWIKTSIHKYISGDFLYIDCDTIITDNLEKTLFLGNGIGAILDTHVTLNNHHLINHFKKEDAKAGFFSSTKSNTRYNGGIIYCKNDTQAQMFYEKWHSLWGESKKRGCSQDMPSLNQSNYELGDVITELNGEWNCQISHNGLPFLANAKIIHYYATSLNSLEPAYKLASTSILKSIKKTGELSPEIKKLLENPKAAFEPLSRIIADKATINALDKSLLFKFIRFLKRHNNKMDNTKC